jgi:beta-phosphoglucomutase-like phosphatase (HAD superfamily)
MIYIVDFDNTLAFTEDALKHAYQCASRHIFGFNFFCEKTWEENRGNSIVKILENLKIEEYADEIKKYKYSIYPEKYLNSEIVLNEAMYSKIFNNASSLFDVFIVCSNTQTEVVEKILKSFNIYSDFDVIVGRDYFKGTDVKPSPSMYNEILKLDIVQKALKKENRILCFDDSTFGLKACTEFRKIHKNKYNIDIMKVERDKFTYV